MPIDAGETANLHGTALALGDRGVLIRGPSGSGKSDLALRVLALRPGPLVPGQPMLIADDRVLVSRRNGVLTLGCPATIEGLIEVRGIGIVPVPVIAAANLVLVVDLLAPGDVPRLPEPGGEVEICGVPVRLVGLAPFEPSAPLKLVIALENAGNNL